MDPITRDLLIRLRWQRSMRSPIEEEATRSSKLERQQARALRERWREARSLGLAANRLEREQHRQRLRDLTEFKKRWSEAMGLVKGFGDFGARTAMWGGAAALGVGGLLAKGFVDAAREADNARMSIATMIQSADRIVSGPFSGVQDSFRLTTDLIQQMRQAALDTPAGFEDISKAFRDVAVPARMAGSSYKDIIDLASSMSTVNKVLGFDEGVVSRDVQQLLRGDISEVQTPMLRSIRMEIQKSFKAGNQGAMLEQIRGALKIDPEMQKVFENSPEGRISQMRDEWELFKQEAGAPVLAWISEQLKEALDYIRKNKEEVKRWAGELGKGVVDALKWIVETLKWMWTNREEIIGWAKWLAGAMGLSFIVSKVNLLGIALGAAFGPVGAIVGTLITIAGIIGAIVSNLNNIKVPDLQGKTGNDLGYQNRRDFGKWGGAMATTGQAMSFMMHGRMDLAQEALRQTGAAIDGRGAAGEDWSIAEGNRQRDIAFDVMGRVKGAVDEAKRGMAAQGFRDDMAAAQVMNWRMIPKDMGVTPVTNIDARGSKVTIHQKVETNNPAALARASLSAGFEAVAKRPIRASQRPGSVRLANGDKE